MFWSLVRPDRISPLRCEVRIVGDEKESDRRCTQCTYGRGAPAHDAHPQGRILNKVSRGAWLPEIVIVTAQAKRAAEDMLELMRRAQSNSA